MPAKKKSGHKPNYAAQRKRAIYLAEGRKERNRKRKLLKVLKESPSDLSNPLHPKHRSDYKGAKAKPDASGV